MTHPTSAPSDKADAATAMRKPTAREVAEQIAARNPKFRERPKPGTGYIFSGASS